MPQHTVALRLLIGHPHKGRDGLYQALQAIRLPPETEQQLEQIARQQGISKTAWVRRLVEAAVIEARIAATPYELAEKLGLIGCIEDGPPDLASNARQHIRDLLGATRSR